MRRQSNGVVSPDTKYGGEAFLHFEYLIHLVSDTLSIRYFEYPIL
jgi:hypothetical protein